MVALDIILNKSTSRMRAPSRLFQELPRCRKFDGEDAGLVRRDRAGAPRTATSPPRGGVVPCYGTVVLPGDVLDEFYVRREPVRESDFSRVSIAGTLCPRGPGSEKLALCRRGQSSGHRGSEGTLVVCGRVCGRGGWYFFRMGASVLLFICYIVVEICSAIR